RSPTAAVAGPVGFETIAAVGGPGGGNGRGFRPTGIDQQPAADVIAAALRCGAVRLRRRHAQARPSPGLRSRREDSGTLGPTDRGPAADVSRPARPSPGDAPQDRSAPRRPTAPVLARPAGRRIP